jgi:hypothetical protein
MAKLGYLFLNEGLWDGQQVVSPAWVEAATTGASYGYQWWLKPRGIYFATGVGGQEIWVLPDRDLVVVMTGATGGGGSGAWGDRLMNSRIIPLLDSTEPLPANPDGEAALESRIQDAAAAVQVQPEPVPPMPEIARQVADQTFVLDANPVGVQSMSLDFPEEAEAVLGLSFVDGNQIEWLIGLDDVLRYFPGSDGLRAGAKGWWESGNVFVIDRQDIGGYARERISAAFEEDQVTIQIQDLNRPDAVLTLAGRLEE